MRILASSQSPEPQFQLNRGQLHVVKSYPQLDLCLNIAILITTLISRRQDMAHARHGDLSFHPIAKLPKAAKLIGQVKSHIAGLGETTGHQHVVKSEQEFDLYEIMDRDERGELVKTWFYKLKAPAVVTHEEHKTITLDEGLYVQRQEQEEDPFTEKTRAVID